MKIQNSCFSLTLFSDLFYIMSPSSCCESSFDNKIHKVRPLDSWKSEINERPSWGIDKVVMEFILQAVITTPRENTTILEIGGGAFVK